MPFTSQWAPSGVLAETKIVVGAMTERPHVARLNQIDNLIRGLIWGGVWRLIDVLWIFAAHTSQAALLNWKNPATFTATVVNSPTFAADQGYTGNGTTSYLNSNWSVTNGPSWVLNNAHISVYCRNARSTNNNACFVGKNSALSDEVALSPFRGAGNTLLSINKAGANDTGAANTQGWWFAHRTAASALETWRNSISIATDTATSIELGTRPVFIAAYSDNGTPILWSADQISAVSFGVSMNSSERNAYHTAIEQYMDAVGAGIVA